MLLAKAVHCKESSFICNSFASFSSSSSFLPHLAAPSSKSVFISSFLSISENTSDLFDKCSQLSFSCLTNPGHLLTLKIKFLFAANMNLLAIALLIIDQLLATCLPYLCTMHMQIFIFAHHGRILSASCKWVSKCGGMRNGLFPSDRPISTSQHTPQLSVKSYPHIQSVSLHQHIQGQKFQNYP